MLRPSRSSGVPKHLDAVSYLTLVLVLAFSIQSQLVVGPLGAAGNPATLLAALGLGWWMYFQVQRTWPGTSRQPVRLAMLAFALALGASYVAAMARPIAAQESSSATLGVVGALGWAGVLLLANDGIPDQRRFTVLTNRLVYAASALAFLGLLQFITHSGLITDLIPPGLHPNTAVGGIDSRAGFTRPAGTALHPIEFGSVLTTVLPIAIAKARHAVSHRGWAWACVAFLGLGVFVSGSRSAILCALVGLVVLAVAWSPWTRLAAAGGVVVILAVVAVAFPGVLGNLGRLFTRAASDGSVQSRTGSFQIVQEFFERAPLFGRGLSTFLPSYRILDDQWLLLVVEVGLVGVVAFGSLICTAAYCARRASFLAPTPAIREQRHAFAAAVVSAAVGFATFDGLSFPMETGVLFLVMGMSGAALRLARADHRRAPRVVSQVDGVAW